MTLLIDYGLVDAAGGNIIGAGGGNVGKPLVVAEVEIGFMAVDGDIAFPVFIGIQGSRVDIDVWVKFLDSYPVATAQQQPRQRTR